MKRLVLEVMETPWCKLVRVIEQTHLAENFGRKSTTEGTCEFKHEIVARNSVTIINLII